MKRYDPLPYEWVRMIWTTQMAKDRWAPVLSAIGTAHSSVEKLSVYEGLRRSYLGYASEEKLKYLTMEATVHGKVVVPLAQYEMDPEQSYYSSGISQELTGRFPVQIRYALCDRRDVEEWDVAYNTYESHGITVREANHMIGDLLSYPQCCIEFFNDVWIDHSYIDTTWQQAVNTLGQDYLKWEPEDRTLQINPHRDTNMMLRWAGVRSVAHLPCTHDCQATIDFGAQQAQLWKQGGYEEEFELMSMLHQWPIEWSTLHGIAEIKTPVFKISTRSDSTPDKYTVQSMGEVFPSDGSRGINFPFAPGPAKVYSHRSFKNSMEDPSQWEENGFSSKEAMDIFHDVVIRACRGPDEYGIVGGSGYRIELFKDVIHPDILDLGCGNGLLLKKLCDKFDGIPHGVEIDHQRYMSALDTIPFGSVSEGDIFDMTLWPEEWYDMIVFMPGRLVEQKSSFNRVHMIDKLTEKTDLILFNLTDDWTREYLSLDTMLNKIEDRRLRDRFMPYGDLVKEGNNIAQLWRRVND